MDNVPSLELCKKLKELWYSQKNKWFQYFNETETPSYISVIRAEINSQKTNCIYAPTVMEMIDILPYSIKDKYKWDCILIMYKKHVCYKCFDIRKTDLFKVWWDLSNALAETIIRCIEEWYLDLTND